MSFETYVLPILIFAVLGLLAGVLLTVASKVFEVKVDERIEKISEVLPQANCGACGFAGCGDYATAIVEQGAATNLCKPGGMATAAQVSSIMGTEAEEMVPEVAVLHCNGDCNATQKKFDFNGVPSCQAAKRFYGGTGACSFGCLACARCGACGKCVKVCPQHLISIRPVTKHIDVRCSSGENGKLTKLHCKNGCIGCKICEKKCISGAITVTDFHASIDYAKCTGCGVCYEACPVGAITNCEK